MLKYHIFLGHSKKSHFNQFCRPGRNKTKWPFLGIHKSKLNFHVLEVDIQNFYEFTILNSIA